MSVRRLRPRQNVWPAVPAAAAIVLSVALAFAAVVLKPTIAELERNANAAMFANDRATARIWFLRLIALDPGNARYQAGLKSTDAAHALGN